MAAPRLGAISSATCVFAHTAITATGTTTRTITITTGQHHFASWTAGENETINISGTQETGCLLTCVIVEGGFGSVLTWGTGFKSSGTLTTTTSKTSTIMFVSNGTNYYELSRVLVIN